MNLIMTFGSIALLVSVVSKVVKGAKINIHNGGKIYKIILVIVFLTTIYEWIFMYPEVGFIYMMQNSFFVLAFGLFILTSDVPGV